MMILIRNIKIKMESGTRWNTMSRLCQSLCPLTQCPLHNPAHLCSPHLDHCPCHLHSPDVLPSLRPSNIPCFIFAFVCAAPSAWKALPASIFLWLKLLSLQISAPWLVFRSQVRTPWVSSHRTLNLALEGFGLYFGLYIQLQNSLITVYLLNLEFPWGKGGFLSLTPTLSPTPRTVSNA